jgi:hypothetical protein
VCVKPYSYREVEILGICNISTAGGEVQEGTSRVLQPLFCTKRISVSSLSPTMQISDVLIVNLQKKETTRA